MAWSSWVFPAQAAAPGGAVVVRDDADLLTDAQERELAAAMERCGAFGNMVFYTTDANPFANTDALAEDVYTGLFGGLADGVVFVINMDGREIYLSGYGDCRYTLPDSYCDTITDNVYRYASRGEYYQCAAEGFGQVYAIMTGKNIPKPMKYICNALLAVAAALVLNFLFVTALSRKHKPSASAVRENMVYHCHIYNPRVRFVNEKRVYIPPASASSGTGAKSGGARSGGGRPGGGHSGGGHRF